METLVQLETKSSGLGFFKVNHNIFDDDLIKNLSGEAFRLYLWFLMRAWRYPHSDGTVRASVSYICLKLPVSHATLSRLLNHLKRLGLLKIQKKDFHNGNLWFVKQLGGLKNLAFDQPEVGFGKSANSKEGADLNQDPGKKPPEANQNEEFFVKYFQQILPKFRKAEQEAFNQLKGHCDLKELEIQVRNLQAKGTLGGASCNCPLSYLAKLPRFTKIAVSPAVVLVPKISEPVRVDELANKVLVPSESVEHELKNAFPDEELQKEYVRKVALMHPLFPPDSNFVKFLAIAQWKNDNQRIQ
jgi:hypothetical protein